MGVTDSQAGVTGIPLKLAKRIRGECCYSGCNDPALDGSDYCAPHDAHERARSTKRQNRHRQKLADAGLCRDGCGRKVGKRHRPDGSIVPRRCGTCRRAHAKKLRDDREKARVTDASMGVTVSDHAVSDHAARIAARITSVVDSADGYARTRMKGGKRGAPSMEEQRRNDLIAMRRILASYEESFAVTYSQEVRDLSREQQAAARRASDAHLELAVRLGMEALVRYGYELPVLHPDEIADSDDTDDT